MRTRSVSRAMTWALIVLALVLPCSSPLLDPPTAGPSFGRRRGWSRRVRHLVSDQVALMTKGRTDGMVVTASYAHGCQSYPPGIWSEPA
jgi:hypothetical protein